MNLTTRILLPGVLLGAVFASCAPRRQDVTARYELGSAGPVISATLARSGGLDAWRSIRAIHAQALVTWYDSAGAGHVSSEEMYIEPNAARITSTGHLPGGSWTATLALDGPAEFRSTRGLRLSLVQRQRISGYLRLILHRVRGPLNLLGGGERVLHSEPVFISGVRAVRVESAGRPALASAYFFGTTPAELKLVTADGVMPPERGSVTTYINRPQQGGTLLPVRLEVRNIGADALLGERKLLDVELTYLSIN